MSILTRMILELISYIRKSTKRILWGVVLASIFVSCQPKEDVVLRRVRDIIVDVTTDPMLRANAILYNPNKIKIKLRKIDVDVYVNEKLSASINQELDMRIPAKSEFTVPLEVKLNMKELGFLDTIFNMIGGKKMKVRYKGTINISYKGVPVRVPVDYSDEIKVKL
jgi:LEA14-like dessication related protein